MHYVSHYLSVPGLNWDAMLDMTKFQLDPISNFGMYVFFEKDPRGVISCISKRYSKASNKYLASYA